MEVEEKGNFWKNVALIGIFAMTDKGLMFDHFLKMQEIVQASLDKNLKRETNPTEKIVLLEKR